MEALAKRAADAATEPNCAATVGATTKRRRGSLAANPYNKPPPPPLKPLPGETLFRILCPAIKTGGVIGKGGSIIKQLRDETGAKIRIDEAVAGCDERVILVVAETLKKKENYKGEGDGGSGDFDVSAAQKALVRIFERMLKVDEEREGGDERENAEEETEGPIVCCRLLAASNVVGCVIGKGGKIVAKIREESGAQIRVLPKDQIPACAGAGDELIQITGNFSAVRKALLSVSSCLQDNAKADTANIATAKPSGAMVRGPGPPAQVASFPQRSYVPGPHSMDYHSRGYTSIPGKDSTAAGHRNVLEEEVMFRLLCSNDKVGSLIGKGGTIIRALQNETGASITVQEGVPHSEERVVLISARESSELKHSPAQDAVMRVHSRLSETGLEKASAVCARLLVPSQQIGCLLGIGGTVIAEMRKATGAVIRIFVKEQVPRCASPNDEVVQVTGSSQNVQGALFSITSKILETIFPMRPSSASMRSRHELTSPGHYSSVGLPHGMDPSIGLSDHQPSPGLANGEQIPYPYGSDRLGHGTTFDHPSSPRSWAPQTRSGGNPRGLSDIGMGLASISRGIRSGSQASVVTSTSVEVVVPQQLLGLVYGENGSNLNLIRQISGANVIIHDPRHGATEGAVVISGTPDQTRSAQSLLHAFILTGQTTP